MCVKERVVCGGRASPAVWGAGLEGGGYNGHAEWVPRFMNNKEQYYGAAGGRGAHAVGWGTLERRRAVAC